MTQKGENEKKAVAGWSVLAAVFLTGFKLLVGIVTGSLGILSEALHSALDLVAAVITWFAVRYSDLPPDEHHSYGHGKIENLSALFESLLLIVTCVWIFVEAAERLITGNMHIEVTIWSYLVVIVSITIDFSRSRALKRVAKKYNSQALEADALHFSTDIWSSAVVLVGLILASFDIFAADSIAAILVGLIVLVVTYRLMKRSIDGLLDRVPVAIRNEVLEILRQEKAIVYFHDLRVRSSGADYFIDITIHLAPELSLHDAHIISDELEQKITGLIPRSKVQVHAEPDDIV